MAIIDQPGGVQVSDNSLTATQASPNTSGSSDPSILSDLGTLGKSALQFIGSPAGGQIITGATGMYEAGQANKQIQSLYAPVQQAGGQFTQAGGQTLAKTQPALTQSIPGQTAFATQQQGVAAQYGTGNLTTAQNAQLQQFTTAQKSRVMAELAKAGITDPNSTQAQTAMQEIDNNAMTMAQSMVQGNQQIATGAENAVQGVYNTLLKQSLDTAGFGTSAQLDAAHGIITSDQQISTALNTLLKGISSLTTTAQQPGGVAQGQQGGGTNVATSPAVSALTKGAGAVGDIGYQLGLLNPTYSAANTQNLADLGTRAQASSADIQSQVQNWQPNMSDVNNIQLAQDPATTPPALVDPSTLASDNSGFSGFDMNYTG